LNAATAESPAQPQRLVELHMNSANRPIVLVAEGSDAQPLQWLKERAQVIEASAADPAFADHLSRARGLLVRTYTKVNDALLDRAPNLKVVGRGGVGRENIDVAACRRRGIEVVYTPDANTLAVGDFVFGYILQLLRPWAFFRDRAYEPREFKRIRDTVRGSQLNELTMGILGMGRVGRRVGKIAADGFGMRVIYNDLLDVAGQVKFAATPVDKPTLYREADILSLHVTMLPGNLNLVGAAQLAMLKPNAIVINTSRGEVLDVNALAEALRAGRVAGAALDVFHPEPPAADFPLLGMDNVLLTPHLAARTATAMANMSWVVKDVIEVLEGRVPRYPAP
jgi:phosphoglycerate dehydrogenase-like enzyme